MITTVTKREVEYTVVLTEDEADLLAAILGRQNGYDNKMVQGMFDSLTNAGARWENWKPTPERSDLFVRVEKRK